MDNMAHKCPLRNLPCTSTDDVASSVDYVDEAFEVLDYFRFFLGQGYHDPFSEEEINDPEGSNCRWTVGPAEKPWPLTRADCTISLSQAIENGKTGMEVAIQYFHTKETDEIMNVLLCSLRIMASDGASPGGACDYLEPDIIPIPDVGAHGFGAYFA